ncbi:MAG: hypothetical protein AAGE03_18455, partial [Pseudomonadota bacterium]
MGRIDRVARARIEAVPLPDWSLMSPAAAAPGTYSDCFATRVPGAVDLPLFVSRFYATPLFRAERLVLRQAFGASSRDGDLARLADGTGAAFAVWEVMGRDAHQIWLRDRWGATMSWLAAE